MICAYFREYKLHRIFYDFAGYLKSNGLKQCNNSQVLNKVA